MEIISRAVRTDRRGLCDIGASCLNRQAEGHYMVIQTSMDVSTPLKSKRFKDISCKAISPVNTLALPVKRRL